MSWYSQGDCSATPFSYLIEWVKEKFWGILSFFKHMVSFVIFSTLIVFGDSLTTDCGTTVSIPRTTALNFWFSGSALSVLYPWMAVLFSKFHITVEIWNVNESNLSK